MPETVEPKTEIVGGLQIKDVAEGGTVFEVKYDAENEEAIQAERESTKELLQHLKLECLDFDELYDGSEPFRNIAKKMHNLLTNGQVKKRILRDGYGSKPDKSSTINIHYNAYVQYEAEPFDSTYVRKKPFMFTIGEGEVIEGLEVAVLSMQLNEKAQFLIEPELAYRGGGLGRIPPNSVVLFEIELCDVKQLPKENLLEVNNKSFEVVYPACLAMCAKGKSLFKVKNYQDAIKVYAEAANKLEEALLNDYSDQEKSEELLVRLYTNLLVSCTHAQIPKRGCVFAQKIYDMAKNETFQVSAKVYFNHAKCQRQLGGFDHARRWLMRAKALEPDNKEIQAEIKALNMEQDNYRNQQKRLGNALVHS